MTIRRIHITMPRNDRRYVAELESGEEAVLLARLQALREAGLILDYNIESMWVDPFDKVRLQDFLSDLEQRR